jgi:hypothetical protein
MDCTIDKKVLGILLFAFLQIDKKQATIRIIQAKGKKEIEGGILKTLNLFDRVKLNIILFTLTSLRRRRTLLLLILVLGLFITVLSLLGLLPIFVL